MPLGGVWAGERPRRAARGGAVDRAGAEADFQSDSSTEEEAEDFQHLQEENQEEGFACSFSVAETKDVPDSFTEGFSESERDTCRKPDGNAFTFTVSQSLTVAFAEEGQGEEERQPDSFTHAHSNAVTGGEPNRFANTYRDTGDDAGTDGVTRRDSVTLSVSFALSEEGAAAGGDDRAE